MPHKYSNRKSTQKEPRSHQKPNWRSSHRDKPAEFEDYPPRTNLTRLIEQDAPLSSNSQLVLMYGPFQTELVPEQGQGVASWIRECIHKYGLPSLVRFDIHRRAQVFRRDQFQPWLAPLIDSSIEQAC